MGHPLTPSLSSNGWPQIEAFVFDNDGVFTNGTVFLMPGGEQVRTASTRDGYAVQHAAKCGLQHGHDFWRTQRRGGAAA